MAVAKDEIAALQEAMRSSIEREVENARIVATPGQSHVLRVPVDLPCDPRWSVTLGSIAHHMRAALDGMVYQLARLVTDPPNSRTQFPIFLQPDPRGLQKQTRGLRREHIKMLEQQQPYQLGNGDAKDPLWRLHQLNNADKHRLIQVVSPLLHKASISLREGGPNLALAGGPLRLAPANERGAHIDIMKVDDSVLGAEEFRMSVGVDVVFDDGCDAVKGSSVAGTLLKIHARVQKVLTEFESAFFSDHEPANTPSVAATSESACAPVTGKP